MMDLDLENLLGRLRDLETNYYDLLGKYHTLINDYESLKDKYEGSVRGE